MRSEIIAIRYVLICSIAITLIIGIVAAINYRVDPAHLFGGAQREREIADTLITGQSVYSPGNMDYRLVQKFIIENAAGPWDTVIIGSSRVMYIGGTHLNQRSFMNLSVSGAAIEDYLALIQLLRERDMLPKRLILEATPWLLNPGNLQFRWQTLTKEYQQIVADLGITPVLQLGAPKQTVLSKLQLISLEYFIASLKLISEDEATPEPVEHVPEGEAQRLLPDGSRLPPAKAYSPDPQALMTYAVNHANATPPYSLGQFSAISPAIQDALTRLLAFLGEADVQVSLYLAPYHPTTYRLLVRNPKYAILQEVERYFFSLKGLPNVEVFGSYDAEALGCRDIEFEDAMHAMPECLVKIFSR